MDPGFVRLRAGSAVVGLLVLAGAGCGAEAGTARAAAWRAEHDTIGDTIVVRTTAGSEWGAARLEPELRIGQFEGADEYMFGSIRSIAVDGGGHIYVFDSQVPALRRYGPDGGYLGTLGREGGGPGEYRNPDGGLVVLADGRIALRDPGNSRINVYAPTGETLETWRIRGGFNTSNPMVADREGGVYTQILLDATADVTEWHMGMVRYGPDGEPGDTVPAPRWDFQPSRLVARRENSTSVTSVPYSPRTVWALSPLGYMIGGITERYAIDSFLPDGAVLRIERRRRPVPVSSSERSDAQRVATANLRRTQPDWKWNGPPIPDVKPAYAGLFAGQDGRVWVRLSQPGEPVPGADGEEGTNRPARRRWREPVVFDVFEPDGRYLGQVRAPDGFSSGPSPIFRGDHVWAVVRDELDVPYVTRFRIVPDSG